MNASTRLIELTETIFVGFPPLSKTARKSEEDSPIRNSNLARAVGLRALQSNGTIQTTELELVIPPPAKRIPEFQLRWGDVLIAIRGSLEKSAIVTEGYNEALYATSNIAVIRPKKTLLEPFFLWSWMQAFQLIGPQSFRRSSTGQLSISTHELAKLPIKPPSIFEQKKFVRAAESIREARSIQEKITNQYEKIFNGFLVEQFKPTFPDAS